MAIKTYPTKHIKSCQPASEIIVKKTAQTLNSENSSPNNCLEKQSSETVEGSYTLGMSTLAGVMPWSSAKAFNWSWKNWTMLCGQLLGRNKKRVLVVTCERCLTRNDESVTILPVSDVCQQPYPSPHPALPVVLQTSRPAIIQAAGNELVVVVFKSLYFNCGNKYLVLHISKVIRAVSNRPSRLSQGDIWDMTYCPRSCGPLPKK